MSESLTVFELWLRQEQVGGMVWRQLFSFVLLIEVAACVGAFRLPGSEAGVGTEENACGCYLHVQAHMQV